MTLEQLAKKLTAAGCQVRESKGRLFVNSTPNGGRGQYGFLEVGDDGSTVSCQGISKRKGEIAAILRA